MLVVMLFSSGENDSCCILSWSSHKIRRVVKSTVAAEGLALIEGIEDALYMEAILSELLSQGESRIPMEAFIDCKNLHDAIYSAESVGEKRLRIDVAAKMLARDEICQVHLVSSNNQLANCLTKKGASSKRLMEIIKSGSFAQS